MLGTVIDIQIFTHEGIVRDSRAQQIIHDELQNYDLNLKINYKLLKMTYFNV